MPRRAGDPAPGTVKRGAGRTVRLRPANPFDLIRLIAHSQNDPRKAMAELVQNSLDAGAAHVTITRWSRRGEVSISVLDDGRGIFPELDREEALERIATNVGHSFKRNLSPEERQREMMLGKYGIGILGFWSVGREMEMRSRVGGSEVWCLRLVRDEPMAEVLRVPERRIEFPGDTWTEIVIRGVHAAAARQTVGRRLGDYLASELRGQLLERKVKLRIVDRKARGTALKDFLVKPQRYRGARVEDLFQLSVVGHPPARLELYLVDPDAERDRPSAIALTCGGTVVCDDLSQLEAYGFAREPWSSRCLEGFIEFPDLEVAPATRRGFVPGPAADALFEALRGIEPALTAVIESQRQKRLTEEDEDLAREIRRVFRPVARALPQYDFFDVAGKGRTEPPHDDGDDGARVGRTTPEAGAAGAADGAGGTDGGAVGPDGAPISEVVEAGDVPEPEPEILPPGPLESVRIVPRKSRLLPGASRVLVAKAVDSTGRRILEGVDYAWSLRDGAGRLEAKGDRASYHAPDETCTARIFVEARQWKRAAEADAVVEVVERLEGESSKAGIPDPRRIHDPAGDWRSRVVGRRWEYNAAHPDYQLVADDARRRLRYLVHLFAKEIVLRNYGEPKDERLLERVVEVLTHIEGR
ncbi:MAG: ATP-binding protein [Planctomycetes bacterium]|nr:ATP-binding protein [Planctomycetota bacterium]